MFVLSKFKELNNSFNIVLKLHTHFAKTSWFLLGRKCCLQKWLLQFYSLTDLELKYTLTKLKNPYLLLFC